MANIPELNVIGIIQIEANFITVFRYENLDLHPQTMCERMIAHSFHDKLQYLADRPDGLIAARKYFASQRRKSISL